MGDSAYVDGLRMLARRELSTAQVRARLAKRDHDPEAVDAAIERLTQERALDDARAAAAIARSAFVFRRLGPRRVRQAVDGAGIAANVAEAAVRVVFDHEDQQRLVEAALERRLSSHEGPIDDRMAARLYRHLLSRGHDADLVARVVRARRRRPSHE